MAQLTWIVTPDPAPRSARTPLRPSQIVRESAPAQTEDGHVVVVLKRTSTGGTRREAQFARAAIGPMSATERAQKKRVQASLFPQERIAAREKDAKRHRDARRVEQVEKDQQTLKGWPALVARLQDRSMPLAERTGTLKGLAPNGLSEAQVDCLHYWRICELPCARQAAARLGVELVPPVPDDLPHESAAARVADERALRAASEPAARAASERAVQNYGQVQLQAALTNPEPEVAADAAKPRKRATHEVKWIGGVGMRCQSYGRVLVHGRDEQNLLE